MNKTVIIRRLHTEASLKPTFHLSSMGAKRIVNVCSSGYLTLSTLLKTSHYVYKQNISQSGPPASVLQHRRQHRRKTSRRRPAARVRAQGETAAAGIPPRWLHTRLYYAVRKPPQTAAKVKFICVNCENIEQETKSFPRCTGKVLPSRRQDNLESATRHCRVGYSTHPRQEASGSGIAVFSINP